MRWLIGLLIVALGSPAAAQDFEAAWIERTLRDTARKEWFDARRHNKPRPGGHHHHVAKPKPQHVHIHPETRVYGIVSRGPAQIYRDATSHVQCWPKFEHIGGEFESESRAMNDARLGWEGSVALKYGARYAEIKNSGFGSVQCVRTAFSDTWVGRNAEAAKQAVGLAGYKMRCVVVAEPCMAPTENAAKLKGDQN